MRFKGRTAIRTGATLALAACAAGPAAATVISLPCYYDHATGKLSMPGTAEAQTGALVEPYQIEGGFVAWDWWSADPQDTVPKLSVLEHCASGQVLAVSYGRTHPKAAQQAWQDMVHGTAKVTLRQIGEAVAELGGSARIGKGGYGDCACTQMGY